MKLYTANNLLVKYIAILTFPENKTKQHIVKIENTTLDALIFNPFHIKWVQKLMAILPAHLLYISEILRRKRRSKFHVFCS